MVPDIPRIYTAIAEWGACMTYVLTLKKRFKDPPRECAAAAAFLGVFCVIQIGSGYLPVYLWIPGMIVAMLATYFCMYSLCKIKPLDAVFWAARAFVLAEFAASLYWQFYYYLTQTVAGAAHISVEIISAVVAYGAVFVSVYFLERRYEKNNLRPVAQKKGLVTVILTAALVFTISNISFVSKSTPLSGTNASEIFYIRTLVDFCGVILFYAQSEQRLWLAAKYELGAMQNILNRQYEQYIVSKENIDVLNRRYHDLKYQITAIRAEDNPEKRNAYLEEMEEGIKFFEAQNKTGNKVLDILLTGKSIFCVQNGINFTCIADGTLLDFVNAMDLCSIVGNALDNAIESVGKLDEAEKRIVKMAVYRKENFVMLRFENYVRDALVFENSLPVTTKRNAEFHGYGLKSIKAAAEKYGGSVKIGAENNWFTLCVLLPCVDPPPATE